VGQITLTDGGEQQEPGQHVPDGHEHQRREPLQGVLDRDDVRADEEDRQEQGDLGEGRAPLPAVRVGPVPRPVNSAAGLAACLACAQS
jgi:hypothetical protein